MLLLWRLQISTYFTNRTEFKATGESGRYDWFRLANENHSHLCSHQKRLGYFACHFGKGANELFTTLIFREKE